MTDRETYFEKVLTSCATMLGRWTSSSAVMWELTVSHKTLTIVLTNPASASGNLVLSCLEPIRLKGPVRWERSNLVVSRIFLPEDQDDGFLVEDQDAGVEIACGAVEIRENVKLH